MPLPTEASEQPPLRGVIPRSAGGSSSTERAPCAAAGGSSGFRPRESSGLIHPAALRNDISTLPIAENAHWQARPPTVQETPGDKRHPLPVIVQWNPGAPAPQDGTAGYVNSQVAGLIRLTLPQPVEPCSPQAGAGDSRQITPGQRPDSPAAGGSPPPIRTVSASARRAPESAAALERSVSL